MWPDDARAAAGRSKLCVVFSMILPQTFTSRRTVAGESTKGPHTDTFWKAGP